MVDTVEAGPRERILQAALELFVEKGYFNTNIPDISKKSRCSVGSIYHHFLNKEEIAGQLYHDGLLKFRAAISDVIDDEAKLDQVVRSVIVAFLYFAEQNKLLAKYIWLARHNEFLSNRVVKPTVLGLDKLGRQLAKAILQAKKDGMIADLSAEVIWTLIFGLSASFILDWLDGNARTSPTDLAPVLAEASWAALQSAKAKS